MISKESLKELVADLRTFGRRRVRRVAALTKKHGVLCNSQIFSDGNAG